jgi:hypothetical protein
MSTYTDLEKLKSLMKQFRNSPSTEPSKELMNLVTKVTDANNSANLNKVRDYKDKLLAEIEELLAKKQVLVKTRQSFNELNSRSRASSTASTGSINLSRLPNVPKSSSPSPPPPPSSKLRRTRRKNRSRRRRS